MMSMAEVEMEDDDETVTRPLTRDNLPRFSLRTGVTWSNVDIEPMTEPLATARRIDPEPRDEWSAWTSPTTEMVVAMPPRSETTVTRPMMRVPERVEVTLPPLPHTPRPKLESGLRPLSREGDGRKSLPPVPSVPRPAVQSDVPLPRPRARLASVGLRRLESVQGPHFERAPALPTPPLFPMNESSRDSIDDQVELAPAFRMPLDPPRELESMPVTSLPLPTPSPAPHAISSVPSVALDRFDSSNHTKRVTLPPMTHTVGLPVVQGFQDFPRSLPASVPASLPARPRPVPWLTSVGANRVLSSPFFLLAFAVSLVAMSVLGFAAVASSASESRRAARTRTITASDIAGSSISDATAYVDGSPSCTSLPCKVELADGAHWITVRATGYDVPPSRAVRTGGGEPKSVHFGLTQPSVIPLPTYNANPPVATEVPALPATAAPAPMPAVVPHAQPAVVAVAPQAAPPVALSQPVATPVAPTPISAAPASLGVAPSTESTLNINSLPVSNILLDGKPLGQTPKLRVKVKPGNHSVMFIRNGKRVVRGARVGAGESVTVSVRL
jgi:hypothetical protein